MPPKDGLASPRRANGHPDLCAAAAAAFEVAVEDGDVVRAGWSTAAASLELGTDARGWGYGGTAMKSHEKK